MFFRSLEAEFLLKGGQSQTWLLGHKLVTITTSGGGGNKFHTHGLCDKCLSLYQGGEVQEKKAPETPGL